MGILGRNRILASMSDEEIEFKSSADEIEPQSDKTIVIEKLFFDRWNGAALSSPLIKLRDIQLCIEKHKVKLSLLNMANFFKDLIRIRKSANSNWPASVLQNRYSARQVTGDGNCFEFIKMLPDQKEPFPEFLPPASPVEHCVQSLSVSALAKKFGRNDESWLMAVTQSVQLLETHFALYSSLKDEVINLDVFQASTKFGRAEIDGLAHLTTEILGQKTEHIIACEAKTMKEDVFPDQLRNQVLAIFNAHPTLNSIIPVCIKAAGVSKIRVVECMSIEREGNGQYEPKIATDVTYLLCPFVPGIG